MSSGVGGASLLLPLQNQVRELDANLLLAVVAAARGFRVVLGFRNEMDFAIASLPRGVYVSKALSSRTARMFGIARRLGFRVAGWDEEAVVHYPPEIYFSRRMGRASVEQLDVLLAWGEDNASLFREFPGYPGTPIHVTGNPRGDLLRPELRPLHQGDADALRRELGDFVLVNTNFGSVNAFYSHFNLAPDAGAPGAAPQTSGMWAGMPPAFAAAKARHKRTLFEHFLTLLPVLHDALPGGIRIVVRPHPSERRDVYEDLAARHPRLVVRHDGNVVPWLLASRGVVHNGCTTAVEAYVLGVPALAYRPVTSDELDDRLPNDLSLECFSDAALVDRTRALLDGSEPGPASSERDALIDRFIAARSGPLACERIADVLAPVAAETASTRPSLVTRLDGRWRAGRRRFTKRTLQSRRRGHKQNPEFQRHRYPGVAPEELTRRMRGFADMLGHDEVPSVSLVAPHVYLLERPQ